MQILQGLALFTIFISAFVYSNASKKITTRSIDESGYRLNYSTVTPIKYEITIKPNLVDAAFNGEVVIDFQVKKDNIEEITMHSSVEIISAHIDEKQLSWTLSEPYSFVIFKLFPIQLNVGNHTIKIVYKGTIQRDMTGLYLSSYTEGRENVLLGATQFSPTHARKAFPCFDEPKFKATFLINIDCPQDYNCLSNMRVDDEKSIKTKMASFLETPRMSTYLVAFVISKLFTAKKTDDGNIEIITRPGFQNFGDWAFDVAKSVTTQMENHLKIKYFEPDNMKQYHVAIPDFQFGGMENWGLISYREILLLFDEKESSVRFKQLIATSIAHEIAHMWFGNLVTQHWWSDLWLKDGFASYFQYNATHNAYPEFGLDDQFIIDQVHEALNADSKPHTTPLTNPNVNSPSEISSQFNSIQYKKGAAVMRMVENLIGVEAFQKALNDFLVTKSYDFAIPDDFFASLDKFSDLSKFGTTAKAFMESWTMKSGYPLLHVKVDHANRTIILTQERFGQKGQTKSDDLYSIPITYITKNEAIHGGKTVDYIMSEKDIAIQDGSLDDEDAWVVFNVEQTGFFRVQYDAGALKNLIKALTGPDRTKIHRINRAQIINDAFHLALSGYIDLKTTLDTIQFLEFETDYVPWAAAFTIINVLRPKFERIDGLLKKFDKHILTLMTKVLAHLGYDSKGNYLEQYFRSGTLIIACDMGDEKCIHNAKKKFAEYRNENKPVDPSIRESVYCNAIRHGGNAEYDFLWQKFQEIINPSETYLILASLACSKDPEKVKDLLGKTLDAKSGIRAQDVPSVLFFVFTKNVENIETTMTFLKENLQTVTKTFGSLSPILQMITPHMNKAQLNERLVRKQQMALNLRILPVAYIKDAAIELKIWTDSSDMAKIEKESIASMVTSSKLEIDEIEKTGSIVEEWLGLNYVVPLTGLKFN